MTNCFNPAIIFVMLLIASTGSASISALTFSPTFSLKAGAQNQTVLAGTSWQLVEFDGSADTAIIPDDRTRYTITFGGDGRVSARIDCNRGTGNWRSAGANQIIFGPLALTRAMCPPGSLHDQIVKHWTLVRSYTIKDGHLFLSLRADGGTYEFEPVGGSQSSEEKPAPLFGTRWGLLAIDENPIRTNKPYLEFDNQTRRFSGNGGCNHISGGFQIDGTQIKFSQVISTQRACIDIDLSRVEGEFVQRLGGATKFQIQGDLLSLYGDRPVLTFTADTKVASAATEKATVRGTITYRQRIALSPNAVVEVKLIEGSRADAPAKTLAEQTIRPAGKQVPIAFELTYDPARIDPRGTYFIQVRILEGTQLRFASTDAYRVITGGNSNQVNVIVKPVGR
jgi:heat shock protein HslJ